MNFMSLLNKIAILSHNGTFFVSTRKAPSLDQHHFAAVQYIMATRSATTLALAALLAPPATASLVLTGGYAGQQPGLLTALKSAAHDSLLPLTAADVAGFTAMALGLIVSAASGMGGSGILLPIYLLVFSFPPKHAVPLAVVTTLGGGAARGSAIPRPTARLSTGASW
jgi:hypothetical protein